MSSKAITFDKAKNFAAMVEKAKKYRIAINNASINRRGITSGSKHKAIHTYSKAVMDLTGASSAAGVKRGASRLKVSSKDSNEKTLNVLLMCDHGDNFVIGTRFVINEKTGTAEFASTTTITDGAKGGLNGQGTGFLGRDVSDDIDDDLIPAARKGSKHFITLGRKTLGDSEDLIPETFRGYYTKDHEKIAELSILWLKQVSREVEHPVDGKEHILKPAEEGFINEFNRAVKIIKSHIKALNQSSNSSNESAKKALAFYKKYDDTLKAFTLSKPKKVEKKKSKTTIAINKATKDISFKAKPEQVKKLEKLNTAINKLGNSQREQDIKDLHKLILQLLAIGRSKTSLLDAYLSGTAHDLKSKSKKRLFNLIKGLSDHKEECLDSLYASIQRTIRVSSK